MYVISRHIRLCIQIYFSHTQTRVMSAQYSPITDSFCLFALADLNCTLLYSPPSCSAKCTIRIAIIISIPSFISFCTHVRTSQRSTHTLPTCTTYISIFPVQPPPSKRYSHIVCCLFYICIFYFILCSFQATSHHTSSFIIIIAPTTSTSKPSVSTELNVTCVSVWRALFALRLVGNVYSCVWPCSDLLPWCKPKRGKSFFLSPKKRR